MLIRFYKNKNKINLYKWHRWFAWRPIIINETNSWSIVWLRYVERLQFDAREITGHEYGYKYKLLLTKNQQAIKNILE